MVPMSAGHVGEPVVPGLVDRVDHLTAAVADLGFRLDTLVSSTAAFREALSNRLTDYADLVARWSIEAEDNVASYRNTVNGLPAAVVDEVTAALGKVERRTTEAFDALGDEVRSLREALARAAGADDEGDEALAAVLAEVAALRQDVRSLPTPEVHIPPFPEIPPYPEIPPFPEFPAPPPPVDLSPLVAALAVLQEEVTALKPAEVDATVEELRGLRRELARQPDGQAEAARLAQEIAELRAAVLQAAADEVEDATETEGALESLTAEVAALREALAEVQVRLEERPPVPPEVTALVAELQALRTELQEAPEPPEPGPPPAVVAAPAGEPVDLEPVRDALAELTFEVRALRKRFPVRAQPE